MDNVITALLFDISNFKNVRNRFLCVIKDKLTEYIFHVEEVFGMKVFIVTRKRLMILVGCLLSGIMAIMVALSPNNALYAKNRKLPIYCTDRQDKSVSISFEQTQTLIDILKDKGVKATFFLVGFWAEKYPESVKAIADAGHDVGNHSDTHPHLPKMEKDKISEQIEKCNKKIESAGAPRPILFRPP